MKTKISSLFLSLLAIFTITSCTTTDYPDNQIPSDAVYALATLINSTDEGIILDYQKDETSSVERLIAPGQRVDLSQTPLGSRVLIAFNYIQNSTSVNGTDINLYYIGSIFNADLKFQTAQEAFNFSSDDVTLESVWLTGDFLNMALSLNYSQTMRLNLVCDQATADSRTPVIYLMYEADNLAAAYPHTGYASFNISSLWKEANPLGFILKVKDSKTGTTISKEFTRPL